MNLFDGLGKRFPKNGNTEVWGSAMTELTRRELLVRAGIGGIAVTAASALPATAATAAGQGAYTLETPYFRLGGQYGKLTELAVDPTGRGKYEKATLNSLYLGAADVYDPVINGDVQFSLSGNELRITNITIPQPAPIVQTEHNTPIGPLVSGHTTGQAFVLEAGAFVRVGGQFPTWGTTDSGMTLTLYSGTPEDGLVQIATAADALVSDNSWVYIDVPTQGPGTYYLEMSQPTDMIGWWAQNGATTVDLGGPAYADRVAVSGRTMTLQVIAYDGAAATASWTWKATGPRLASSVDITPAGAATDIGLTAITPWVQSGYSTSYDDGVLFSRFISDDGRYMPAHQLKRQTTWGLSLAPEAWIYATGTGPYDLRLSMSGVTLTGTMGADSMTLSIARATATDQTLLTGLSRRHPGQIRPVPGGRQPLSAAAVGAEPATLMPLTIDVVPHTDRVPLPYPAFSASDNGRADQLNQFFYERAYSRPYGNATDWQDWEGRILDWSDTGALAAVRQNLLTLVVGDDGYVYGWGSQAGWPFPDPNTYDTRHFSTNAMYVLGICRYYSWTGDVDLLNTLLPGLRRAVDFLLNTLHGSDGLLRIDSADHTGDYQALGSNYWDITAFGYLSAYENAYFYGMLQQVAALETHLGNTSRARQLSALLPVVQRKFNETFWDDDAGRYVQCIDVYGVSHDYGSSYVNLEAASFGLPSAQQAARIFDWLDNGVTRLSTQLVKIDGGTKTTAFTAGHTLGEIFTVPQPLGAVGVQLSNSVPHSGEITLSLYADGPGGRQIASRTITPIWPLTWVHLEFGSQPAGTYYLEASNPVDQIAWCDGASQPAGVQAYVDGAPTAEPLTRALVAVTPDFDGPADIYSRWVFAPRATTRRNDFWYFYGWNGVDTPWERQLQDGGTSLYISGFDIMSRALYRGGDDAWQRFTTILDRWAEPDHLCGGDPLYRGERPQGAGAGQVGVDNPFPESGLAPASFLYGILGVDATPDALVVRPNLPSALQSAGVQNLFWRGRRTQVLVTHNSVSVRCTGISVEQNYQPGQAVRIPAPG